MGDDDYDDDDYDDDDAHHGPARLLWPTMERWKKMEKGKQSEQTIFKGFARLVPARRADERRGASSLNCSE